MKQTCQPFCYVVYIRLQSAYKPVYLIDFSVTHTIAAIQLVPKACISLILKGKAVPLQACSSPEDSRKLRFPDYMTTAQDDGKVVSLTHRPHLPTGSVPGTHFC